MLDSRDVNICRIFNYKALYVIPTLSLCAVLLVSLGSYIVAEEWPPYPTLRAKISASLTVGDAPLTVTFTPIVSGGIPPYTYLWLFDDGTKSTEANPIHTFEKPGFYRIVLTVKDSKAIGYTAHQVISVTKGGEVYNPIRTVQNLTKGVANAPPNATYATEASSESSAPNGGRCLIATAAFGSELTPQVQFLRNFRDKHIMSTLADSSFMNVFNTWYYSFSPYIADYERGQPWLQQSAKSLIYPLISILHVSERAYSSIDGEYGALTSGLIASSMIGALYFSPFALLLKRIREGKFNYRFAVSMLAIVSLAVVGSILSGNIYALMATTSLFVLTTLAISAILSAKMIIKIVRKLRFSCS